MNLQSRKSSVNLKTFKDIIKIWNGSTSHVTVGCVDLN